MDHRSIVDLCCVMGWPLLKHLHPPHHQSDMLGKQSEPLLAELTVEFMAYLRGALVHQMKQGMRLSNPCCRFRQAPEDRVIVDGVESVYWSAYRRRYLARHRDPDSSKVRTTYAKTLDEAVEFARSGIKATTKQQDGEHSEGDDCINDDENNHD